MASTALRMGSRRERRRWASRWPWAVVLMAVGLMVWSLAIRWPSARSTVPEVRDPVSARVARLWSDAELETLRARAGAARARLLWGSESLETHLVQLEREAQAKGLRVDFDVRPRVPLTNGPPGLAACPVHANLTLPDSEASPGDTYAAVLAWLEAVDRLPVRAELTRVSLAADSHGLRRASAELQFIDGGNR